MSKKICIDAGHYAKYNRSPVVPEYFESEMNWKLSNMEKEILESYGFEVVMTRDNKDADLDLFKRGYASKGCDLFISNHSNACGSESVDYPVAICFLDDNKIEIDDISREIGEKLIKIVEETMGTKQKGRVSSRQSDYDRDGNGILDDEWYGVLNGAKQAGTPGMIIEHSFHTNTASTRWLLDDNNLRRLAENICKGILEYFGPQIEVPAENHNMSKAEFIEYVGAIAVEDWNNRKICVPSVVIAQAIKESAIGQSELAQNANALFGIKKNGWTGEVYIKDAGEQNADGSYRTDKAVEWRKYNSWRESIIDHNDYIATRKIGNQTEPNFKEVIGQEDYKEAVKALQSAEFKYATSHTYEQTLISCIEENNLIKFDGRKETIEPEQDILFRIQVGAYKNIDNAQALVEDIKSKGIDALVIEEDGLYKVQAGLYRVKANADAQLARLEIKGFKPFIKQIAPVQQPKKEIAVGDTVIVLKNETYTGGSFRLYYDKYDVLGVNGDRVVIGIGSTVTCAINICNIKLA